MALSDSYNFNNLSPNSFALMFPNIPGGSSSEMFILSVYGCNLPGLTLNASDIRWQGGKTHLPGAVTDWAQLSVNFVVNEKLDNWLALFKWMIFLNNNKDKYVEAERNKFSIDATLVLLDNWKKPIYEFKFINIFPVALGELPLSSREGSHNIDTNAIFSYDRYEFVA